MVYESIVEKLFDEDNDDVIELDRGDGKIIRFEQVAVVNYKAQHYAIMHPIETNADEVVVFRLVENDEDSLEFIADEELAKKVLEVYTEDVNEND